MFNKDAQGGNGSGRPGMIHRLVMVAYDDAYPLLRTEGRRIVEHVLSLSHYPTSQFLLVVPGVPNGLTVRASTLASARHVKDVCKEKKGVIGWPLNKSGEELVDDINRKWVKYIGQATLVVAADVVRINAFLQYFVEHEGVPAKELHHQQGMSLDRGHGRRAKSRFVDVPALNMVIEKAVIASAE